MFPVAGVVRVPSAAGARQQPVERQAWPCDEVTSHCSDAVGPKPSRPLPVPGRQARPTSTLHFKQPFFGRRERFRNAPWIPVSTAPLAIRAPCSLYPVTAISASQLPDCQAAGTIKFVVLGALWAPAAERH